MKINLPVTGVERSFDTSERIISTTDTKGTITSYNETFFKISGFAAEELDGKNHNVVRHPDMPPAAFENLWSTVKTNQSWMGIVKNRCKNGDHYWVDAYVTPISENGQIAEFQSVRSKPKTEYVQRAEKAYKRLNDDKAPFKRQLSLQNKLYLAVVATTLPVIATSLAMPEATWLIALISLAVGLGLTYRLLMPLRKLCQQTKELVDNPLMTYIYTGRTDEIGQLMLSQKRTRSELDAVVSRLDFSTDRLTDTAHNSNQVAQQSKKSIQDQQKTVSEIATALTQMSTAVLEVAQNAQQAAEATQQADSENEKGKRSTENTVQAIHSLAENIGSAAGVIDRLDEESKAISSVLDVIREIAEQTNLLALNAAIEAARAGEMGRGFAVVADEVRTLATRTQDSITEIESMIKRVQNSVNEATTTMQESSSKAEACSSQSSEISAFLSMITSSVGSISNMAIQIANAAEEQSAVSAEITTNINTLSERANEAVEITHTNGQISVTLNQLTAQLKKLVRQFQ